MSGTKLGTAATAGIGIGVVALALNAFDVLLPPVYEVSGQPPSPARTQMVNAHITNATVVVMALGVGAGVVARSAVPVVAAAGVSAWLAWQYNAAARRLPPAA
jgi:hypothetical protein